MNDLIDSLKQWGHSRVLIDDSYGGLFKPYSYNGFVWNSMAEKQFLFLEIVNYKSGGYLASREDFFLSLYFSLNTNYLFYGNIRNNTKYVQNKNKLDNRNGYYIVA